MTTRRGPHNQTTVPVLDRHGQPLAPARPSRVRRWLESGRAHKVWVKGIFAVQLNDQDDTTAITSGFVFNMDPGEATGIAITRESPDGQHRTIVGAYEHQHRNREIHRELNSRRDCRRNRRSRQRPIKPVTSNTIIVGGIAAKTHIFTIRSATRNQIPYLNNPT